MMTTLLSAAPVTTIGASSAGFNTEAANMGIGGAGITALLGYSVVFFGLVLLMCVIALFGRIMAQKKKPAPAPAPAAPAAAPTAAAAPAPAPGSTKGVCMGNRVCELYNVDDKTAAMIMAIVADETKIPLGELRFISIKEL
jgi:Na+-transporting methylmalonyl-CoA/oxaloacetate decarboxylase gamma subunit